MKELGLKNLKIRLHKQTANPPFLEVCYKLAKHCCRFKFTSERRYLLTYWKSATDGQRPAKVKKENIIGHHAVHLKHNVRINFNSYTVGTYRVRTDVVRTDRPPLLQRSIDGRR